jgi:hypothetical protein
LKIFPNVRLQKITNRGPFNATYLFKAFLPVLGEMNDKRGSRNQTRTISEEIGSLLSDPKTDPKAKESILATINEELQKEYPADARQRKPRTRTGKGLLRSIGGGSVTWAN